MFNFKQVTPSNSRIWVKVFHCRYQTDILELKITFDSKTVSSLFQEDIFKDSRYEWALIALMAFFFCISHTKENERIPLLFAAQRVSHCQLPQVHVYGSKGKGKLYNQIKLPESEMYFTIQKKLPLGEYEKLVISSNLLILTKLLLSSD